MPTRNMTEQDAALAEARERRAAAESERDSWEESCEMYRRKAGEIAGALQVAIRERDEALAKLARVEAALDDQSAAAVEESWRIPCGVVWSAIRGDR